MIEPFRRLGRQTPFARPGRRPVVTTTRTLWPFSGPLAAALALLVFALSPASSAAQQLSAPPEGPEQTVVGALKAACSQNARDFSRYLLVDSRQTFLSLSEEKQKVFLRRFSLTSVAGHARALLDTEGRTVVRCDTPAESVTFRLRKPQIDHNVAFIPVGITGGERTSFGLVHQPDGWRLYSLGLLVINVPTLVRQWERAEMRANEQATMADLVTIEQAVNSYHGAFGKWPDSLKQLGPAPPNDVSPEHAQLLSGQLASGAADGYRFRYLVVTDDKGVVQGFELGAVPEQYDKTGLRSFFLDKDGQLHAADKQGAPATDADPILTPPPEPASQ